MAASLRARNQLTRALLVATALRDAGAGGAMARHHTDSAA